MEAAAAPVLGVFAPGNMSLEWNGTEALPYPSNVANPQTCTESVRPANEPGLAAMTTKAIALLDRAGSSQGFFLQIEGASIDKQSYAARPSSQIGETIAFDEAIRVGLAFARTHSRTLLVVTGDHGHAGQIIGTPTDTDHPSGLISALKTKEGGTLFVSHSTNAYHRSQDHTGTEIRIAATGPQAANVLGVINHTDLFNIMSRAIREPVLFTEAAERQRHETAPLRVNVRAIPHRGSRLRTFDRCCTGGTSPLQRVVTIGDSLNRRDSPLCEGLWRAPGSSAP